MGAFGGGWSQDLTTAHVFNNYVLAVVRTLGRDHVPMPSTRHLEKSLNGLLRSFKQAYGATELMPGRKQPLTPAMWKRIESLPEGSSLGRGRRWSREGSDCYGSYSTCTALHGFSSI